MKQINILKWVGVALIALISIVAFTSCENGEVTPEVEEINNLS